MKLLALFLVLITFPLLAQDDFDQNVQEISLGMVVGAQGDSLLLVDGVKVYVPNLSFARYIDNDDNMVSTAISYPFTASLVITEAGGGIVSEDRSAGRTVTNTIKIHDFYDIVDGRLIKRNHE
ncbi:hypothetical protein JXB22_10835 [candidate division WOR-3 bacterium]|nr:hypothetical protein [candidate division WOR-3 bacterium]